MTSGVVAISTGQFHTVAAHKTGATTSWGQGGNGRLGDGRPDGEIFPVAGATNPKN
jgi:alpha-tubulin suppressor-like RCC1 family protein